MKPNKSVIIESIPINGMNEKKMHEMEKLVKILRIITGITAIILIASVSTFDFEVKVLFPLLIVIIFSLYYISQLSIQISIYRLAMLMVKGAVRTEANEQKNES